MSLVSQVPQPPGDQEPVGGGFSTRSSLAGNASPQLASLSTFGAPGRPPEEIPEFSPANGFYVAVDWTGVTARDGLPLPQALVAGASTASALAFASFGDPAQVVAGNPSAAPNAVRQAAIQGDTLVGFGVATTALMLRAAWGIKFTALFDVADYARLRGLHADPAGLARVHDLPMSSLEDEVELCKELAYEALADSNWPSTEVAISSMIATSNANGIALCGRTVGTVRSRMRILLRNELVVLAGAGLRPEELHNADAAKALVHNHWGIQLPSTSRKDPMRHAAVAACPDARSFLVTRDRALTAHRLLKRWDILQHWPVKRLFSFAINGGAHTGRLTAGGADCGNINIQGLHKDNNDLGIPRLSEERNILELGTAVCGDLRTIEPRVLAWLAGEVELLRRLATGSDAYSWFGGLLVPGVEVNKKSRPDLRTLGKMAILGLGYGMGVETFFQQTQLCLSHIDRPLVERLHALHVQTFPRIHELRETCVRPLGRTLSPGPSAGEARRMSEQRWTEERGREVVRAWRKSGQSMSAFARKHGWNVQRMAYWRDRFEQGDMAGVERAPRRFLPAVVVSSPASPARHARIVFPRGVAIEVEQVGEVAPDWIAALAFALGSRS